MDVKRLILRNSRRGKDIDRVMEFCVIPRIGVGEDYKCIQVTMLGIHKFQPRYHERYYVANRVFKLAESVIDYSPRKICVATTVVTGKSPLSLRELHRSGATSYCHNTDPGLATFRSEAQANCVIIHLRVLVLNNKTFHSQGGWNVKSSCGDIIWWDIFSLVFIDEERNDIVSTGVTCVYSVLIYHEKDMVHPVPYMKARAYWGGGKASIATWGTQAVQNYRDEYRVPMLSRMIRDSIIYFASIFGALLVNCTIYYPRNHVEVQITIVLSALSGGQMTTDSAHG
ncbi:hypothetical protein BU17DRAFT_63792 [Hysterangium stoloniferum]|nr:hypothetical protein BU17DRAFT_63792 [Hysterangium stoloniferum]